MVRTATALLQGRCCSFNLGSSSLAWLCGVPSTLFLLLCLPSGCGHPFGSLVSFVTIDRQRRFPLEGVFLLGGSLPFRSGVVVSLRPLSVCHGSMWLVPVLFPSLSLSFPVCAHLQLGRGFLLLPDCPSPYFGLLVYWFLWLLFSTRVTYLRDGVTPAGSWTDCPRSERRFSLSIWVRYAGQFLAGHPASVCGYLRALSLRVCCLVVLTVSLPLG